MPEDIPMAVARDIPLPFRIVALIQEQNRLFAYPPDRLAIEIWTTKFRCDCCGACCTRAVNGHVFLLDQEMTDLKKTDPASYEPAPGPEFCDQNGVLYVSGYALRIQDDTPGSCWFLENGKCRIYDRRFSICRIYPHMLRRSIDAGGEITWQKFSRRNGHGIFDPTLSLEECVTLAREIKEYENAFLTQQISFLDTVQEYFTMHNLRHDPGTYTRQVQRLSAGSPVDMKVFHDGGLEDWMTA